MSFSIYIHLKNYLHLTNQCNSKLKHFIKSLTEQETSFKEEVKGDKFL